METDGGVYGQTFSHSPFPDTARGFFSHIEIRGNWNDWVWDIGGADSTLNYRINPQNAAHVTCVHENFHGIQFSMFWNQQQSTNPYDYFPTGWIEGTAVLMEHLGFDYIKDYIQYAQAFFVNPAAMPFFVDEDESILYSNSLLTIFLHDKSTPTAPDRFYQNHVLQ